MAFKLRFAHLHADHGGEPFTEVFTGDFDFGLFDLLGSGFLGIFLEHTGHRSAETGQVRTALDGVDVVDVGVEIFAVRRVVDDGHFYRDSFLFGVDVDDILNEGHARGVLVAHELAQALLAVERLAARFALLVQVAFIGKDDGQPGVEESQFAHTVGQNVILIFDRSENVGIGPKLLARASAVGFAHHLHFVERFSGFVFLLIDFPITEHLRLHARGERIDTRHAHTVQTARHLIGTFVELTAGMEHRHHDLERAHTFFLMNVHRDTTAVVLHHNGVVRTNRDFNMGAISCQGFVDRVVHRLIDEVMKSFFADITDIHGRTLAHCFQAFEHLDIGGRIAGRLVLYFFHSYGVNNGAKIQLFFETTNFSRRKAGADLSAILAKYSLTRREAY